MEEEAVIDSEVLLIQYKKCNTKSTTQIYKGELNYIHQNFQLWRKDQSKIFLYSAYTLLE